MIRRATLDDIDLIEPMGAKFFADAYYSKFSTYDGDSFIYYLTGVIRSENSELFILKDGTGFASATVFESPFNLDQLIGVEHLIYTEKPGPGVRILTHMENWARSRGAIFFESSFEGRDVSKIYERLGYLKSGLNYTKRL